MGQLIRATQVLHAAMSIKELVMKHRHLFLFGLLCAGLGVLSGCAQFATRSSSSQPLTSIIETTKDSRQTAQKATMRFPASVAIIFVPGKTHGVPGTVLHQAEVKLREQLLASPKYVRSVSIVSPDIIKAKISLAQLRGIYDADIAVILSYRQDQMRQQSGPGGLMDVTLVGALVVPSVKTKTSTVVDGSIVHIPNDAIIFRSSGSDDRSAYSTSYGVSATMAEQSNQGVIAATEDFGRSLTKALERFDHYDLSQAVPLSLALPHGSEDGAAAGHPDDQWNRVNNFKLSGGGSMDALTVAILLPFVLSAFVRRRLNR